MTLDLFDDAKPQWQEVLAPGAMLLRGFILTEAHLIQQHVAKVAGQSPLRQMNTARGYTMSVAMTSCGQYGWVSDTRGYRYITEDPLSGQPWPAMPVALRHIAVSAASAAGFDGFDPDSCLINRYLPGTRLSLHQDKNERRYQQPVVSFSLGLSATFLFGGLTRQSPVQKVVLTHGDVLVWGGPARLYFHGVAPLKDALPPAGFTEHCRYNLTFRHAG